MPYSTEVLRTLKSKGWALYELKDPDLLSTIRQGPVKEVFIGNMYAAYPLSIFPTNPLEVILIARELESNAHVKVKLGGTKVHACVMSFLPDETKLICPSNPRPPAGHIPYKNLVKVIQTLEPALPPEMRLSSILRTERYELN